MPHSVLLLALVAALLSRPASAAELRLEIEGGFVTLVATDIPVHQILAEWAKVGGTRIVNAERVTGPPVTLQLEKVPEQQALAVLLRSVAGYVAAPRRAGVPGASQYESVMILATSTPPAAVAVGSRPPITVPGRPPSQVDFGQPSAIVTVGSRPPITVPGQPPGQVDFGEPQVMPDDGDPIGSDGLITVGKAPAPRQPTPATGAAVPPVGSPFSQVPFPGMKPPNGPANAPPQQQPTTIRPGMIMPNGDIIAEPEP